MEVSIIPTIFAYSLDEVRRKMSLIEGIVNRVQLDIVGKAFSSKTTVGIEALEELSSGVVLDVQLMVKEPIALLNRCDIGGADRVFGHVEYMKDKDEFVDYALVLGMQVGLGLDLSTPVSVLEKDIESLDAVLLMSVPAGKSGQTFDDSVIEKIAQVREFNRNIPICVDGGINDKVIEACVEAGANEFAVGNYLWESKDIRQQIGNLMEAVK